MSRLIKQLPAGIRSRTLPNINGLQVHVLEAGYEEPNRPAVLLLHGFPELAYSWRSVMPTLAQAGYHVIAPDQRGYGQTTGWDPNFSGDLSSFRPLNLVRDALGVVYALGHREVAAVVGHDFGSPVAGYCALIRPDVFRSLVLMSAPFAGAPELPFIPRGAGAGDVAKKMPEQVYDELETLEVPRKYYMRYFASERANDDLMHAPSGIHSFLRAYFHYKSGDAGEMPPFPLSSLDASELAKMPHYYVMDLDKTMPETVARHMPTTLQIQACTWLNEDDLAVYAEEYGRTGFQGGLNWYRCKGPRFVNELQTFGSLTVTVPSCFIAGKQDWGIFQTPGAFEKMQTKTCSDMRFCALIEGAGHWIQQERSTKVAELLVEFIGAR